MVHVGGAEDTEGVMKRTQVVLRSLQTMRAYVFRVRALGPGGEQDWTDWSRPSPLVPVLPDECGEELAVVGRPECRLVRLDRSTLTIAAPPDAPDAPVVHSSTATSVRLRWRVPVCNHLPVEHCQLQMQLRDAPGELVSPSHLGSWRTVAEARSLRRSYDHTVVDLHPCCTYAFRSRAHNKLGWSEWSSPSELVITDESSADAEQVAHLQEALAALKSQLQAEAAKAQRLEQRLMEKERSEA